MKYIPLLALFLTGISSNANAFTLISSALDSGWDTKTLAFSVNESSCTTAGVSTTVLYAAIDAAFDLWNKVPTANIKLSRGSTTTSTSASNPPVIYCDSAALTEGIAGVGGIAVSGGKPSIGSLRLNSNSALQVYFGNLDSTTQTLVVAHEIGHVLGLGHTEKDDALMYYDLSDKEHSNMSQDDHDGLTWLNPRDELKSGLMGCAMIQEIGNRMPPSDGNGSVLINWILVLMIAFVASRRRNRNVSSANGFSHQPNLS